MILGSMRHGRVFVYREPVVLTISSERGEVTSLSDQQSAQGTATRLCAEGEAQRSAGAARCVDASG